MPKLDLNIGASVYCKGERCGKLHKVVVDPHTQRVTDLIVERGFLKKKALVLPVSAVEEAKDQQIHLEVDREQLEDYVEFQEIDFQTPAPSWDERYSSGQRQCWVSRYGSVCPEPIVPRIRYHTHKGISSGQEVLKRGTPVLNVKETIGKLDHVLVDPESNQITHLIVRRGLIPYYPIIPVSMIEDVRERGIWVKASDEELSALPRHRPRPPADILAELQDRLEASSFDFSGIEATAEDGIVQLTGTVANAASRQEAEGIARSIDGVIDIENKLDTDTSD